MSSEFFKALEQIAKETIEAPRIFEIRAFYDEEGVIYETRYTDTLIEDESDYIVLTQEQYDGLNRKRHRIIEDKLIWVERKRRHWYLKQEDLTTNPYIKD